MSRYINRNLKIVSMVGIIASFVWAYLFYMAIADYGVPYDKFKYIYLLLLLLVSIIGLANSNKRGKNRLKVLLIQSFFYFVLHYFYGIGENGIYKDPFQVFCLLLTAVLIGTWANYESTVVERGKRMYSK